MRSRLLRGVLRVLAAALYVVTQGVILVHGLTSWFLINYDGPARIDGATAVVALAVVFAPTLLLLGVLGARLVARRRARRMTSAVR